MPNGIALKSNAFHKHPLFLQEPTYLNSDTHALLIGSKNLPLRCACARGLILTCNAVKPFLCFLVVRKPMFVSSKCGRVIITASLYQSRRVFDMQHLVIKNVLNKPLGHITRIQRLADYYRFMYWIVVTKDATRAALRPGKCRPLKCSLEMFAI